ncbi:SubName: Full=Uncharacterized protein {ECO:0000313/EMBL:CCA75872.1} [Serendipita indica DSM 11827]|uniref:Uncharacterized protein n=1 Tax=Serendipita indica (strain DSM 11827) TaxID=1109443 RepID=G4TX29_SERID|nr:SubName: Full=Uncharacterized protein {ECO:0000313/EMBL:CCA75872.1} [Serendipita indica DSM 11827]CCA75872.1 hypothetical protein PIIN_09868 [Serendipita indica DSM 11827]
MAKRPDRADTPVGHEGQTTSSLDPPSKLSHDLVTRRVPMPVRGLDPTTSATGDSDDKRQREEEIEAKSQANRARYEQSMFGFSSNGDRRTFSHVHTSAPAMSRRQESEDGENQDDGGSFYSYNSARDVRLFVKEMHGRIWNSMNETYMLPSDDTEWHRLNRQHLAHIIGLGGLYPCPEQVEAHLAPAEGARKQILDVGCGTGSWAIEMAERFPHTLVTGIDLAPTPLDTARFPSNLHIEIDDINLGLAHFHGQFDLVHMRCVTGGINDIDKAMLDLQRCLKPGGILIVIDGWVAFMSDLNTVGKLRRLDGDEADATATTEDGSWLNRIFWEAIQGNKLAGASIDRGREVLAAGLWGQPYCDPSSIVSGSYFIPIGPWARGRNVSQTQQLQYGGLLMRQSLASIHHAFHSILLRFGLTQDVLDKWSQETDDG